MGDDIVSAVQMSILIEIGEFVRGGVGYPIWIRINGADAGQFYAPNESKAVAEILDMLLRYGVWPVYKSADIIPIESA